MNIWKRNSIYRAYLLTLVFLAIAELTGQALAQSPAAANDTVALVNGKPITAADFEERFDLTIHPHKEDASAIQAEKERVLFSLIAEQLLADEGVNSGKFMTSEGSRLEDEATQTYLRDALYRKEIMSKVRVTREDVITAIKRAVYSYVVEVFRLFDTSSAYSFYRECSAMGSARLDSFVTIIRVSHDTLNVVYDELIEAQENTSWGRPDGLMSLPISSRCSRCEILGFSGQINAVPGLPLCADWTGLAPMKQIIIPQ